MAVFPEDERERERGHFGILNIHIASDPLTDRRDVSLRRQRQSGVKINSLAGGTRARERTEVGHGMSLIHK